MASGYYPCGRQRSPSPPLLSKNQPSASNVIGFLYLDNFEVQLYQKKAYQHYRGQPCIVADQSGRIFSVSHEAKKYGITKMIQVPFAMELCEGLKVILRPKSDSSKVSETPEERILRLGLETVFDALQTFAGFSMNVVLEYASSNTNGFFIDMTEEVENRIEEYGLGNHLEVAQNVYLEVQDKSKLAKRASKAKKFEKKHTNKELFRLLCGADYMTQMSDFLKAETGFECSIGVGNNKLIAKLGQQVHKPKGITVVAFDGFPNITDKFKVKDLPALDQTEVDWVKEEFGENLNLRELGKNSLPSLEHMFGEILGRKLFDGSKGICVKEVISKGIDNPGVVKVGEK